MRRNRMLWAAGALLLVVAALSQLGAQDEEGAVRAQAFALENAAGELVGMLATDSDGAPFLALGSEGGPQLILAAGAGDASLLLSAGANHVIVGAAADQAIIVVTNGDEHAYLGGPEGATPPTATKPLSWGDLKDRIR